MGLGTNNTGEIQNAGRNGPLVKVIVVEDEHMQVDLKRRVRSGSGRDR